MEGQGHGVRLGLQRASGDIIAFQDADLELDPQDLVPLVGLIVEGKADVAFGKRFGGHNRLRPNATVVANHCLSFLASLLLWRRVRDIETCYKVFKGELLSFDRLKSDRFEIDIEVAFSLLSQPQVRYVEWPIRYQPRKYGEGKKIRIKDGVQAIWIMLACWLDTYRSRRKAGAKKKEI